MIAGMIRVMPAFFVNTADYGAVQNRTGLHQPKKMPDLMRRHPCPQVAHMPLPESCT